MSENCPTCRRKMMNAGRELYTPEQFKKKFTVGDIILGWSTNKPIKITAMGERRFLYTDNRANKEHVAAMNAMTGWKKYE